jgi:hypothetical protein
MMFGSEIDGLFDRPVPTTGEAKERATAEARRVVEYLHRTVFPLLGATPP